MKKQASAPTTSRSISDVEIEMHAALMANGLLRQPFDAGSYYFTPLSLVQANKQRDRLFE
jgi:prolyl-tRNA synthetase